MAKNKHITIDPETKSELKRLRKLERDHNLLKEEHALLKKAIQFSSQQKKVFEFIDDNKHLHGIALMCRVYNVSRHGYNS
jgi:hypothetical protein